MKAKAKSFFVQVQHFVLLIPALRGRSLKLVLKHTLVLLTSVRPPYFSEARHDGVRVRGEVSRGEACRQCCQRRAPGHRRRTHVSSERA